MRDAASLIAPFVAGCRAASAALPESSSVAKRAPAEPWAEPRAEPRAAAEDPDGLVPRLGRALRAARLEAGVPPRPDQAPAGVLAREAEPSEGGAAGARRLGVEGATAIQELDPPPAAAPAAATESDTVPGWVAKPPRWRDGVAGGEGVSSSRRPPTTASLSGAAPVAPRSERAPARSAAPWVAGAAAPEPAADSPCESP